ncbi:uncharacterized protein O3C94_017128 [Discoglossus pictus]
MAFEQTLCKSGLVLVAVCMMLTLQGTEAQTNSTTGVPGWGVALLVLTSLILASLLCSLCCVPLLCKKHGGDHCGFSLGK